MHHEVAAVSPRVASSDEPQHVQDSFTHDYARLEAAPLPRRHLTSVATHRNARVPHGHAIECVQSLVDGEDRRERQRADA